MFIEQYDKQEIFRLSPWMKTEEAIYFIQENDFCGAEYNSSLHLQVKQAAQHDLILVPPDTITEYQEVQ